MDETGIRDLLRRVDRIAGPPPMDPLGLADRVRRLRAYRRRMLVATGGAVAALVAVSVGAAFFVAGRPGQPLPVNQPPTLAKVGAPCPDTQPDLDRLQAQIEALRAEANSALALARQVSAVLDQQHRLAELKRASATIDPREEVRRQMDKAAFTIVYQADRMYRELDLRESAVASYRQAISLFPDTPAAKVARQRLSEIESSKGDKL